MFLATIDESMRVRSNVSVDSLDGWIFPSHSCISDICTEASQNPEPVLYPLFTTATRDVNQQCLVTILLSLPLIMVQFR